MGADIVLLGHGSRRGTDTDEGLADAVARLQARVPPPTRVRLAGLEFTRPSLPEAVSGLVKEGSRRIIVVPFFLFEGKHMNVELPELLGELRRTFPDLDLLCAGTLGIDRRLIDLVLERVDQALVGPLSSFAWGAGVSETPGLGVILVNRGSRREFDSGQRLRELAGLVRDRLGPGGQVAPAQAEYASPTILEAAESLIAAGAGTIVTVPYIFFPGKVLYDNILPATHAARQRYPSVEFRVAPPLGIDDRLLEIVLERAEEALDAYRVKS